ncbi:GlsB/YeaQ/YmgE family stress response membrane protein [Micromonospora sp. NPDC050686]|uniref:GlsB/YeaQ/YmgE family stress response membrane protein n=1 Tax=Micromonospora sp. NPDC050686 TaxID=3154631 RepID=UPI0033E968B7
MSAVQLISAVVVGLVVGAIGRLVVPGRERVPVWVALTVGVAAAVAGTIAVRVAGGRSDGIGFLELLAQIGVAGAVVVLVAATAGRRGSDA